MNQPKTSLLCKENSSLSNPSVSDIYRTLNNIHGIAHEELNGEEKNIITSNFDSSLYLIENFMRYIEISKSVPFIFNPSISVSDQKLFVQLQQVNQWSCDFKAFFRYSPHVSLFFETIFTFPVAFSKRLDPQEIVLEKSMGAWANEFTNLLRERLHSRRFKDRLRHREENAKRSYSSSIRYIQHQFERHSRLLVLRMDFAMKNESFSEGEPLDRLLEYFSMLRSKMKRRSGVFKHMLGYIAHLEYALVKGHHLHAIFFFDGHRVRNGYNLSRLIANLWRRITDNRGIYFNPHEKISQYQCPAIGMIQRSDEKKRCCLAYVIWYITKLDQQLMYKYSDRQRVFFRGEIGQK
jgi:hypothetical protein